MPKTVLRREFLKQLSSVAGSALLFGNLGYKNHLAQEAESVTLDPDFTIVELVDIESAKSLDGVLSNGKTEIPRIEDIATIDEKGKRNIEIDIKVIPTILYSYGKQVNIFKERDLKSATIYPGCSFILNKYGFFLATYHQIKNIVEYANNSEFYVGVLYDPDKGIIRIPKILSYSKKYEIALGKIDVPSDFTHETISITKATPKPGDSVYMLLYDNKKYTRSGLFMELFSDEIFSINDRYNLIEYIQKCEVNNKPFREYFRKDLDPSCNITTIIRADDSKARDIPKDIFYLLTKASTSDSGSPVFSLKGDLVGIVLGGAKVSGKDGKICDVTGCVKPTTIRAMIENYIIAVDSYSK